MKKVLCLLLISVLTLGIAGCGSNTSESDSARIPYSQTIAHKKDYQEVVSKIEAAGFTNVKTEPIYDLVTGFLTKDGSVEEIRVGGSADYSPDKKYPKDIDIVVSYHTFTSNEEVSQNEPINDTTEPSNMSTPKEESAVYYSTNDSQSVKQGDSGVYAYHGDVNPNLYYIIDFEDEYVYRFTDDENSCDRIKIESGNLNDVLVFTYHDGDTTWSNGLHFKWKNQPNHLILQDDDGFEWDFYPTDLDSALKIRSQKQVIDY